MANTYSAVTTGFNVLDPNNLDGTPIFTADSTGVYSNGTLIQTDSSSATVTAHAGGGQPNATLLSSDYNLVTVCATNFDSVKLPIILSAGLTVTIKNIGAAILSVFPNTGATINALAVNLSIDIPVGGQIDFTSSSTTAWRTPIVITSLSPTTQTGNLVFKATASAGNTQTTITNASQAAARTYTVPDAGADANFLMTQGAQTIVGINTFTTGVVLPAVNGITAFSGGGQGSATAITAMINRITTSAAAGDSVKLPAATAGLFLVISNSGAAYANVFPASGDAIDALAINTAVSLPVGGRLTFTCSIAGTWVSGGMVLTPTATFVTNTTTTTFLAGQLTGGAFTCYVNSQGTPGSIATRSATQMFTDNPGARVGGSYLLRIVNGQGTGILTVTAGSSVTLTGTATIAINSWRDFVVTYNTATTLTMQNIATGTYS